MTMIRGPHAVNGPIGEMILIDSNIAIIKKYTFASLLNCNSRASM